MSDHERLAELRGARRARRARRRGAEAAAATAAEVLGLPVSLVVGIAGTVLGASSASDAPALALAGEQAIGLWLFEVAQAIGADAAARPAKKRRGVRP